jgi:aminoglycoside 3-N-acetyltransferase
MMGSDETMLVAASNILYVRAALKPLARPLKSSGGVIPLLKSKVQFEELLVPHFFGPRPFWRRRQSSASQRETTSGALGRQVAALPGAVVSQHPTHAFAGFGERVTTALAAHDHRAPCFGPIGALAAGHDLSMLLLGCVTESPGFSTVHVAQNNLGLSQRHLGRLLLRWDFAEGGVERSKLAPEFPGCSLSFGKFYGAYEADQNLVRGAWHGVDWIFVPSARRALAVETQLLRERGRFVDCGRLNCVTCRLRLY